MSLIEHMTARELLDSRGNPTLEVEVVTKNRNWGRAIVPSGASTGAYEACEIRDGDDKRFLGRGVLKAVKNVKEKLAPHLVGIDVCDQSSIDKRIIELDGTENKGNLGANTLLGVSLACARAGAEVCGLPLYRYIGGAFSKRLPVPYMNILNGGLHADNNLDIQEFMIVPHGFPTFKQALQCGVEIFHALKHILKQKKLTTAVGDEGGFAPNLSSNKEALDLIIEAVESCHYHIGKQVSLALDVAASSFWSEGRYDLASENTLLKTDEMVNYIADLCHDYPIISVEDPLDENDWEGFQTLQEKIGSKIQVVGDDLFVTNPKRLIKGIETKAANAILIKLNQIGTLTETLECIELAKSNGFKAMVSHRSGESEDTTIADLAVATNCGQIKTGSLSRTDRICKYNQLLRIEEELMDSAEF